MTLLWLGLGLALGSGIINVASYLFGPGARPRLAPAIPGLGVGLQAAAYALTLLRLPYAGLPYLLKLGLALVLGRRFEAAWDWPALAALRLGGEALNWGLTTWLLWQFAAAGPPDGAWLAQLAAGAELVRLLLEKGQMLVSAGWQRLPHQRLAAALPACPPRWARAYQRYYRRSEAARLAYLARLLRRWRASDPSAAVALAYVRDFALGPPGSTLRVGRVRQVAQGLIWVQPGWSSDPWLLIGLALRRSPWLFDPRHLRRPFYYRSEANPRATRLVLSLAHWSPPFALYQLGHEIKAARFELFFRLGRALGLDLEAPVLADGTYQFDPLLKWLRARLGQTAAPPPPLWTPAAALADLAREPGAAALSAAAIATRYTFPLSYVEEVLLPALRQKAASVAATVSGTSHWG